MTDRERRELLELLAPMTRAKWYSFLTSTNEKALAIVVSMILIDGEGKS